MKVSDGAGCAATSGRSRTKIGASADTRGFFHDSVAEIPSAANVPETVSFVFVKAPVTGSGAASDSVRTSASRRVTKSARWSATLTLTSLPMRVAVPCHTHHSSRPASTFTGSAYLTTREKDPS